jgi:hypothetical protein
LGASVSFATSPVSPLDPGVKQAVGWAYTAYGFIRGFSGGGSRQKNVGGKLYTACDDQGRCSLLAGGGDDPVQGQPMVHDPKELGTVFINTTMPKGEFIVFEMYAATPIAAGHAATAFQINSEQYLFASVNGNNNPGLSVDYFIGTREEVINLASHLHGDGFQYDAMRSFTVKNPDMNAVSQAFARSQRGYSLFGNNCADFVVSVGKTYGVSGIEGNLSYKLQPNLWFGSLGGTYQRLEHWRQPPQLP